MGVYKRPLYVTRVESSISPKKKKKKERLFCFYCETKFCVTLTLRLTNVSLVMIAYYLLACKLSLHPLHWYGIYLEIKFPFKIYLMVGTRVPTFYSCSKCIQKIITRLVLRVLNILTTGGEPYCFPSHLLSPQYLF